MTSSKQRNATKAPAALRARRKKEESDDEQSPAASSDESESDDIIVASRSNKRRKAQTAKLAATKRRRRSILEASSDSESDKSESAGENPRTPTRRQASSAIVSSGSRSRRASAQKAMSSMAVLDDDDDDDDLIPRSLRKNRNDDDDFELEQVDEEEESDEELGSAEDDDELVKNRTGNGDEKVGLVDDGDIGSAEESEEEPATPFKAARLSVLEHQSPVRITKSSSVLYEYEDEESSDDDRKQPAFSASVPQCDSTNDAITDADLPEKHVCFFSPDGKSKQCFALDTLHKIATSSMCQQIRQTLTGRVVQTFLQPPHFRSAMSDDLLDQIASRFGRDALDLHGDFYKRPKEGEKSLSSSFDNDESGDDEPSREASHAFVEQVQNYVRAQMGSRDLYVCPVCWLVARRRYQVTGELDFDQETEKDDDTLFTDYTDGQSDPMEVLGTMDDSFSDSFVMASSFCFPTVAKVKYHLVRFVAVGCSRHTPKVHTYIFDLFSFKTSGRIITSKQRILKETSCMLHSKSGRPMAFCRDS